MEFVPGQLVAPKTPKNWISVSSSNVKAIAYAGMTLGVRFKNGTEYRYFNVPEEIYKDFLAATSKGKFLAARIKGVYSFRQV